MNERVLSYEQVRDEGLELVYGGIRQPMIRLYSTKCKLYGVDHIKVVDEENDTLKYITINFCGLNGNVIAEINMTAKQKLVIDEYWGKYEVVDCDKVVEIIAS